MPQLRLYLWKTFAKLRPDSLDLTPEAVAKRAGRDSEQVSDFLPLVGSGPKRQNGCISPAKLSNDSFEVQASFDLADPDIVYGSI